MKAEAKALWLEALRSGRYTQARWQLCNSSGAMCCLGVLIDVTQDGDWSRREEAYGWSYDGNVDRPPAAVLNDVGLVDIGRFTRLNDLERKTFAQIANYIEANE